MGATKCMFIKLKPGSEPRVREWAEVLNSRQGEVYEALRAEGVELESAFLTTVGGDDYLVYVMRAPDFDKARAVAKASTRAIDAYHKQFKLDAWLERQELECLVDFSTRDA